MQSEVMTPKTSPPNINDYLRGGGGEHPRSVPKTRKRPEGNLDYTVFWAVDRGRAEPSQPKCGEERAGVGVSSGLGGVKPGLQIFPKSSAMYSGTRVSGDPFQATQVGRWAPTYG